MTEPRRRMLWPAAVVPYDQRRHHLAHLRARLQRQRTALVLDLPAIDPHRSITTGEHAMPRIIEVIVSPDGATTIQTKGYHAGDCLEASRFLEQTLGVVAHEQKTNEFYQAATAPQSQVHQ